ncbi:MAG: glutamyl-tRNA reductase [Chloroflexi bacterium]|nr:glutamyl-tRNA reductase [Chloroflexota bacterium]
MQILALGLDHHRADVRLRERLQVADGELPWVLGQLREQIAEGAILSTCNRTELYALVGHRETGRRAAIRFLADARRVPTEAFAGALAERWQEDAIRHLLRVSCGLESMIVGEHQILGQVRAAGDAARAAGSAGPILSRLFRDALTVGKRARVESGIARNAVSVSSAAVELAQKALGGLDGRTALVIGAGKMGSLAARSLLAKGVSRVLVISRTTERARMLAERVGGVTLAWDRLEEGLAASDLVIASTAATDCVVTREVMGRALADRRERPLVVVDIAVPRDVEPAVGDLAGCSLYNIDDLAAVQEANLAARRLEAVKVEVMIEREVEKFMGWWIGHEVAPTIAELVARAEEIRLAELERGLARLDLSERERNAVNAVTTAIVNKMLHRPIVALKARGGRHDANVYVHAVRELFGLPEQD